MKILKHKKQKQKVLVWYKSVHPLSTRFFLRKSNPRPKRWEAEWTTAMPRIFEADLPHQNFLKRELVTESFNSQLTNTNPFSVILVCAYGSVAFQRTWPGPSGGVKVAHDCTIYEWHGKPQAYAWMRNELHWILISVRYMLMLAESKNTDHIRPCLYFCFHPSEEACGGLKLGPW